ncbi:twitchin-like [Mytilus trossulus]|uniref:twitchin-like n=1 Tax=Mytilus trossulus TaxID=6551 RepID=UPI003004ABC3
MDLKMSFIYLFSLMVIISWTGTLSQKLPLAPQEVVVSRSSWKTIRITWNEPKVPVSGYRIFYSAFDIANLDRWQSIDIGPHRVAEITGLEKMAYAIRVAAKSKDGSFGNASAAVLASEPTLPPEPQEVVVSRSSWKTIRITWNEPKVPVSGYRIFYSLFDFENLDSWQSIDIGPHRVAEITGLEKQSYAIRVAAKSLDGRLGNASAAVLASEPTYSSPSWKPKSRPAQRHSNVTKNEGNDVKLTCGVNGNPKPSIIWYRDGRMFDDQKRSKTTMRKYSLIIKDAQVDDEGDYKCIVKNEYGSLNFTFYVTVEKLTWPLEVEEPQNLTVNEGDDAIFICRPLNDPEATIKWVKRDPINLNRGTGKTSDILENKEMLVLRSVTMRDAGHYSCVVGNYFGLRQVDVWLKVKPTPTSTTTTTNPRKEEENDIKCSTPSCLVQQKDLKDTVTNIVKQLLSTFEKNLSEKVEAKVRETTKKIKDQVDSLMIDNENLRERMKAKDKTIETLEEQVSDNINRVIEAIKLGNYNEQYSIKRNIRILNYPECPNEVLRDEFVNMVNKELKIDVKPDDVQEIHRIPGKEGHTKPVIVKVRNTDLKIKIMRQKGGLKNGIRFHDDITQRYMDLMGRLENSEQFENVWFFNCNVYAKQQNGSTIIFDLFDDIEQKLKTKTK